MKRTACGGCGNENLEVFLDLGSSPRADAFPAAPGPEDRYPLQLGVCRACWLVQLMEIVPAGDLYGAGYAFYASSSPDLVEYDKAFAGWVLSRWPDHQVVEIACNDGCLLRHFPAGVGVEPAAGPARAARQLGLHVVDEPFTRALAANLDTAVPGPRVVIAKNVLAHVDDLDDMVAGVALLIRHGGVAVIEVQALDDLLAYNQFDHVYHEHRFYLSPSTLRSVLHRHGLAVVVEMRTPAQGGSIRVVAMRRQTSGAPADWTCGMDAYAGVQGRADHLRRSLLDLLARERAEGRNVAGYAASAKSATLLNWCGIGTNMLDYIVDTTPHKIGRVTPGTHIPVVAPGGPDPHTFLMLARNYLGGALRRESAFTLSGGRWIVPIPQPVVI